jgi:sugar lactone lactonase YvrE
VSFGQKGLVIVWSKGNSTPSQIYDGTGSPTSLSNIFDIMQNLQKEFEEIIKYIGNLLGTVFSNPYDYSSVPNSLFVTPSGDIYVGNDEKKSIDKWTRDSAPSHIRFYIGKPCHGLFVDISNKLYCSVRDENKVIKKLLEDSSTSWEIAVQNKNNFPLPGSPPKMLDKPYGIFVDTNFNLYVADNGGNRIQRFNAEGENPDTLVNASDKIDGYPLNRPTSIVLDADRNLYIVDSYNHRIVFVRSDSRQRLCLLGCSQSSGSERNQLKYPIGMSFDHSGNILITDTNNNRVQKFGLKKGLCGKFNKYSE